MIFFYTLVGDALLFSALIWFSGYGALGPATGLRLRAAAKLRLFAEVFVATIVLLYLFITIDQLFGWSTQSPWPGSPGAHRLLALAVLLTAGYLYTRRRAQALHEPRATATSKDEAETTNEPPRS